MRIDVRDDDRRHLFTVDVDPASPPTVARGAGAGGGAVHLDWDRALDDEQHLRHCPVCGCEDLFVQKRLPQLTAFVLILAAAVVAMVLFGFGQVVSALVVLGVVAVIDGLIYVFARRVLICYRCHSRFSGTPISRYHGSWDRGVAERYGGGA